MNRASIRVSLALCATAYALLLSTKAGRTWAQEQTWATVVAGNALVLAHLAAEDRQAATRALTLFSIAAVPIVARSLAQQLARIESYYDTTA